MAHGRVSTSDDEFAARVSLERHRRSLAFPLSPLSLIDGLSRKSVSYDKLPQKPLKLSVLKFDGSSFGNSLADSENISPHLCGLDLKDVFFFIFSANKRVFK